MPSIEQSCWEAFRRADVPVSSGSIALGGPIPGIGWGTAIHDPVNRFSAKPEGEVSLMHFAICEPDSEVLAASEASRSENEKDLTIAQQRRRLAELERELQTVYASRSWRITAPLRKGRAWFRRFV